MPADRGSTDTHTNVVRTKLGGFYKPSAASFQHADMGWVYDAFVRGEIKRSVPEFLKWCGSGKVTSTIRWMFQFTQPAEIHDARALEAVEGLSKPEFFRKFGFVLLDHHSAMSASDWANSSQSFSTEEMAMPVAEQAQTYMYADTPAKRIYAAECEDLIRQLFPAVQETFAPAQGARRGPGGYEVYSPTVHADFPLDFAEAAETNQAFDLARQRQCFAATDTSDYYLLNFWRSVLPMQKPLLKQPLCFCDPRTIHHEDLVVAQMDGQVASGQRYVALKYRPEHRYYYYPEMTTDEVLVFKTCHYHKGQEANGEMPVFHQSFIAPNTPADAEARCSFEYRVGLTV